MTPMSQNPEETQRNMQNEEYSGFRTDIELLKRDVSSNHALYSKIDSAIEKMADVANNLSKMLMVHEHRLETHSKTLDALHSTLGERKVDVEKHVTSLENRIGGLKTELTQVMKEQEAAAEKLEARTSALENWKWYVLGISAALAFVLSQLPQGLSAVFAG